jgi:hypothetical protein
MPTNYTLSFEITPELHDGDKLELACFFDERIITQPWCGGFDFGIALGQRLERDEDIKQVCPPGQVAEASRFCRPASGSNTTRLSFLSPKPKPRRTDELDDTNDWNVTRISNRSARPGKSQNRASWASVTCWCRRARPEVETAAPWPVRQPPERIHMPTNYTLSFEITPEPSRRTAQAGPASRAGVVELVGPPRLRLWREKGETPV